MLFDKIILIGKIENLITTYNSEHINLLLEKEKLEKIIKEEVIHYVGDQKKLGVLEGQIKKTEEHIQSLKNLII